MNEAVHVILIVDDNDDIREVLAEFLQSVGYQVQTARNGLDALRGLYTGDSLPCLILLDLMMPVMDGFQFLEAFRGNQSLSLIPVVVVSGQGTLSAAEEMAIAAPFLPKPLDLDMLLDVVALLVEGPPASPPPTAAAVG